MDATPPDGPLIGNRAGWPAPQPCRLAGRLALIEPLDAARHGPALLPPMLDPADVASWTYMSAGPFTDAAAVEALLAQRERSSEPLFHTPLRAADRRPVGMLALMRPDPAHGVVEVGSVWWSPAIRRTPLPTEALALVMAQVFEGWRYRRLEWKCDALNTPSRRAALRLGFRFEGIFRQHMVIKGRNRDTAWFAILDHEWPAIRAAMTAWLDPANFDAAGVQRRPLAASPE